MGDFDADEGIARFEKGDSVEHRVFGIGTVEAVEGDRVTVAFKTAGTKRLLAGYAPLRRIVSSDDPTRDDPYWSDDSGSWAENDDVPVSAYWPESLPDHGGEGERGEPPSALDRRTISEASVRSDDTVERGTPGHREVPDAPSPPSQRGQEPWRPQQSFWEKRKPLVIGLIIAAIAISWFIPVEISTFRLREKYDLSDMANITLVEKTEDTAVFEVLAEPQNFYIAVSSISLQDVEVGSHGTVANSSGLTFDGSYEYDHDFLFAKKGNLLQFLVGYYFPPDHGHVEGVVDYRGGDSSFDYANYELGFFATFPSEPSEHTEQGDLNGTPSTTHVVYSETPTATGMVTVVDGWSNVALIPDETWEELLGDMLADRYRFATGDADARPAVEFGRIDGNLAATTVFPWKDDSGKDMWVFYTMLFRDDDRFYEYTGSRLTESDAGMAAASFGLLVPGDEPVDPQPESSQSQMPDGAIEWTEAGEHVGDTIAVCGPVVGSKYASDSRGKPTFVDIGARYPESNRVSIVIWEQDRDNFASSPEDMYSDKTICVTGVIEVRDDGSYSIEVQSPSQVRVVE